MNEDGKRNSYIQPGEIYFWTATIHKWHSLLLKDEYKAIIMDALAYLSNSGHIDVFSIVIMPNHIHLIWRVNKMNGKESAKALLLKFTAHEFKKVLQKEDLHALQQYKVTARNKQYEFWQRDSLAVPLFTRTVAYQKMDYIHANPVAEHWNLITDPCDYTFSSARFYERGENSFCFLKDLREVF